MSNKGHQLVESGVISGKLWIRRTDTLDLQSEEKSRPFKRQSKAKDQSSFLPFSCTLQQKCVIEGP